MTTYHQSELWDTLQIEDKICVSGVSRLVILSFTVSWCLRSPLHQSEKAALSKRLLDLTEAGCFNLSVN